MLTRYMMRSRPGLFLLEFLIWWHEAGRVYYGRGCRDEDEGLRGLAREAVRAVGGPAEARRLLRGQKRRRLKRRPVPERAIRLRTR